MIDYNCILMIYIGANQLLNLNLQIAYAQLYTTYEQLAISHQKTLLQNREFAQKLEKLQKQNERIRALMVQQSVQNQRINNDLSQQENPQAQMEITIDLNKKTSKIHQRIKRLESTETSTPQDYACTYDGCNRIYKSAVSMNMHIKIKHNGGTKKERQEYAKMIIDAEEKGQQIPQIPVTFPTNFLEQFRRSYAYMKKYCM